MDFNQDKQLFIVESPSKIPKIKKILGPDFIVTASFGHIRDLEKKAVLAGGGKNHRFSLSDMILVKENHLKELEHTHKLNTLSACVRKEKEKNTALKAEVEIENIDQLHHLDLSAFDYILFDNFSIPDLQQALPICRHLYPNSKIEISGNVSLENINQYSDLNINRISIGALTHSVKACDITFLIL